VSEAISPAPRALWRRILPRRVSTWLMTAWTAICGLWLVVGVAGASGDEASADCVASAGRQLCDDAGDVGSAIGVGLIILLWFIVFAALALVALLTRKRSA
jgi:hypothetical protein